MYKIQLLPIVSILTYSICALSFESQQLETKRLILRPTVITDTAQLAEIALDPDVRRLTGLFPKMDTNDEVANFIETYLTGNPTIGSLPRYPKAWSVIEKSSGNLVGLLVFVAYSDRHRKAEIGYAFNPKYWNHGYATETCQAIIEHGFKNGLVRIYATVDPQNIASERVLQKSEMTQEGLMRAYMIINNQRVDRKMYAVIAPEE